MGRLDVPNIAEVVQLLGLKVDPNSSINADSFNVRCPFCGDKKYHMNINAKKGCYSCVRCCGGEKGLRTLDLYGKVRFGTPHRKGAGGNGRELMDSLLKELGRADAGGAKPPKSAIQRSPVTAASDIPVASNKKLDAAYRFLFSWEPFKLTKKHFQNLVRRGLDKETISRNGYATMPEDMSWLKATVYDRYRQWYVKEKLGDIAAKYDKTKKMTAEEIIAGLAAAGAMREANIDLNGVPGAFVLGKHWCFLYKCGMMIPTRDIDGHIVGIQVRTDAGKLRYMTISSKGLPKGPTSNISKAHFPLGNAPVDPNTEVLFTEGPLKGDITTALYPKPVFVVAVQGVNNTKELNAILRTLKLRGAKRGGNAFDMDKILNQCVRGSSKKLSKLVKNAGLDFYQKCWDVEYCQQKIQELETLCQDHHIKVKKEAEDPFRRLAYLADSLYAANVPYCVQTGPDGTETHDYWRNETKGIDDYLLTLKKGREKAPEK